VRPARLHFFNEQDAPKLEAPFADALVAMHLEALGAGVTMWLRDLRMAARACGDVSMFSLEGCVQQGFLARLLGFDWDGPVAPVSRWRRVATATVRAAVTRVSRLVE